MNCTGQLFVLNFKLSFFSLGSKCMPLIHVLRSSVRGQLSISPLSQSTHSSAFLILRKLLISIFTFFFPFLLQFFENNVIKPEKIIFQESTFQETTHSLCAAGVIQLHSSLSHNGDQRLPQAFW